jgi:ParB-like chromosome segregation protein Spo0J
MLALGELVEAKNNPNRMEPEMVSMLAEAIRREGFLQPILVRPTLMPSGGAGGVMHEIIDGHHRVMAAKEAGMANVPCVIADVDDYTAIALRIGMNRLRGDLDLTSTAREIQKLLDGGWDLSDLTVTGFAADEVADLVRSLKTEDVEIRAIDEMHEGLEDDDAPVAKPFSLEVIFKTRDELKRVKKALKKAAGKSGDYGKGLLRLIGE